MSVDFNLWLTLLVPIFISRRACAYDWHGGDWVMENLKGTDEPIGVKGEWSDYVNTLAGAYDENQESTSRKQFITDRNAGPPDWFPLTPNEIPYLAVLYRRDHGPSQSYKRFFEVETDPGDSHIEPGTACGAALLTSRYALSVCGCLMSLIANVQGVTNPSQKDNTFRNNYDIFDSQSPPSQKQQVFMTHSLVRFTPDFRYEIEQDRNKWLQDGSLNCKDLLVKLDDRNWNRGVRDDGKKAELLNSQLILAPFKPEVQPGSSTFFPMWPPRPVNDKLDPAFLQHADLISIGMRFSKPPDRQFFSSISASSVEMKHCIAEADHTAITCNATRVARGHNYTCFCPISVGYNLYGGTIGWPIVQQDELSGLTASERDSKNGFVAAAIVSEEYIKIIEGSIGKAILVDQNTPPPVYRHRDLAKKYFIYDYGAIRSKYKNRPDSKATTNRAGFFLLTIVCITWIGTTLEAQL